MVSKDKLPDLLFDEQLLDLSLTEREGTAELVKRDGFGIVLAMNIEQPPEVFLPHFNLYSSRKIKVIGWPFLADEHGYWPNDENFAYFSQKLTGYLTKLKERGINLDWICLDLEPSLVYQRRIMEGSFSFFGSFARAMQGALSSQSLSNFSSETNLLLNNLHRQQYQVMLLAPIVAVDDLAQEGDVWQKLGHLALVNPKTRKLLPFDAICFMLFPSEFRGYAKLLSGERLAKNLFFKTFASYASDATSIAKKQGFPKQILFQTGILGNPGKRGKEPIFAKPEDFSPYARQFNTLAKNFGVSKAYYGLEGIAKDKQANNWLKVIQNTETAKMAVQDSNFIRQVRKLIYKSALLVLRTTRG
ncbi:hypothetical protein FJZ40_02385 [Candidatus Shapirobacteria bacterium]|nr:hypothetical protein [Candidatus Shapirobacteria bacterium]